ncbi:MAG: 3-methyl-2-oxobutanoate hydroxymethyltransferase [Acidimicrobiia bacterium]|nr:3-methyl-2-oxobutanoate hydroxymethyltransferase [Acidimicrobiia bacterium]
MSKLTVKDLLALKGQRQLTQVYVRNPGEAAACEAAGIDLIVTEEGSDVAAIRAAAPETFFTVGLLYGRYPSVVDAMRGAYGAMSIGADCIYCPLSLEYVRSMAAEAVPVTGHVGFVPYKSTWFGGFKAVGKTAPEALKVYDLALAHQDVGAIGVEVEIVPQEVAAEITRRLDILTLGMGAGPGCDAQYLFATDILGDNTGHIPRHAKVYRDHKSEYERLHRDAIAAFGEFKADVDSGTYPASDHVLRADESELAAFVQALEDRPAP